MATITYNEWKLNYLEYSRKIKAMENELLDKLFGPPLNIPQSSSNLWKYAAITVGVLAFYLIARRTNEQIKENSNGKN